MRAPGDGGAGASGTPTSGTPAGSGDRPAGVPAPALSEPHPGLDPELRDGFAALRRQEEAAAPRFAAFANRVAERRSHPEGVSSPHRRLRQLAIGVAAVAVAGATLVISVVPRLGTHAQPAATSGTLRPVPSLTAWRPATDFLLRTPGQEVLVNAPTFGREPAIGAELGVGSPADGRDEAQRRPRT